MSHEPITLVHIKSSPYGSLAFEEGMDVIFAYAAFGQNIAVLLSHSAVNAFAQGQTRGFKNANHLLDALEVYDINQAYYCEESLREKAVNAIPQTFTAVSSKEIHQLIHRSHTTLTF